jgi:hypothetical protein
MRPKPDRQFNTSATGDVATPASLTPGASLLFFVTYSYAALRLHVQNNSSCGIWRSRIVSKDTHERKCGPKNGLKITDQFGMPIDLWLMYPPDVTPSAYSW